MQFRITSVKKESSKNEIQVYPNPSSGIFHVKELSGKSTLQIIDFQGRVLQNSIVNDSQTTLDLSAYPPGMYLLKIENTNGFFVKKLNKLR